MSDLLLEYRQMYNSINCASQRNKGNLRDLIAATGLVKSNWIQIVNFPPVWPWNLMDDLKNKRALLLYYVKLCSFQIHWWIQTGLTSPETLNSGGNWWYVIPCDLEIWWMTLKNKRALLLCYFRLCAAFRSHRWIQPGVTVRKRPIWVKFNDF